MKLSHARIIVALVAGSAGAAALWILPDETRPFASGLAVALILALAAGPLTKSAGSGWSLAPPASMNGLHKLSASHSSPGPFMVGLFEVLIFYGSFVAAAWAVAAGWLVFKAASKWAVWQHIARVPATGPGEGVDDWDEFLAFRHAWASKLLNQFTVGTAVNLVAAMIAYGVVVVVR